MAYLFAYAFPLFPFQNTVLTPSRRANSKWSNGGSQPQVLRSFSFLLLSSLLRTHPSPHAPGKLHLLTLYLRAIDLGSVLRTHYSAFAIAASLTKSHNAPIIILPSTPLGIEAWNAARRPSRSILKRAFSSNVGVVPGGVLGTGSSENSDAELDGVRPGPRRTQSEPYVPVIGADGVVRRPGMGQRVGSFFQSGNRSRSNTVITAVVVEPGTLATEESRRTAGAGTGHGTGLLSFVFSSLRLPPSCSPVSGPVQLSRLTSANICSAPPNYDGRDLPGYIAANPSHQPHSPNIEVDLLPDYA